MKKCKKCQLEKEINEYPKMGGKLCKICFNEYMKLRRPKKIKEKIINNVKICNKCGIEKELFYFYKQIGMKDGHEHSCKSCKNKRIISTKEKEYREKYYKEHKIQAAEYKQKNVEKIKDYQKIYQQNTADKRQKYYKKYRSENKDKINQYNKNRCEKDPLYKLIKKL